jgi:hypothetical protein
LTSENISILNSTGNKIIDSSSRNDLDSNESANSTFTSVDSKNLMTINKRKKVKRSNKVRAKSQDYFTRVIFFFLSLSFFLIVFFFFTHKTQQLNLSAVKEKVKCIVWDKSEWKGADLSMLEISNSIILNAKKQNLGLDYFYLGMVFSFLISCKLIILIFHHFFNIFFLVAPIYFYNSKALLADKSSATCKYKPASSFFLNHKILDLNCTLASLLSNDIDQHDYILFMLNKIIDTFTLYQFNFVNLSTLKDISSYVSFGFWFKLDYKLLIILINTLIATIILCMLFFSLLSIAERTLKQVKLINNFLNSCILIY